MTTMLLRSARRAPVLGGARTLTALGARVVAVGAVLSASIAFGAPAVGHPPRVVDANGRVVGSVLQEEGGTFTVLRQQGGGVFVRLLASPDRLDTQIRGSDFFFEAADCSPPAFLAAANPPDFFRYTISDYVPPAFPTTVLFPGDPIGPRTIRSENVKADAADCASRPGTVLPNGRCCVPFPSPADMSVGPLQSFDASVFTPPFRVR